MGSYTCLLWTVGCSYCTPADVVHPQPGKSQTACATVQGHLVHYAEGFFWRYKKGGADWQVPCRGSRSFNSASVDECSGTSCHQECSRFSLIHLQFRLASELAGQAFHNLRPGSWWKHRDLPSLLMQNTKAVNLRHMR